MSVDKSHQRNDRERERREILSDDVLKLILGLNSDTNYGLKETINDLNEMIKSFKDEVTKNTNAIVKIHTEKILATQEVNELKKRVNILEQRLWNASMEVVGLEAPKNNENENDENNLIGFVNKVLNTNIENNMVALCHIVPSRRKDKKRVVLCRFVNEKLSEEILNKKNADRIQ